MPKSPQDFNVRGSGGKISEYLPEQNSQRILQLASAVSSGGEPNTASNQGTDGVGVYDAKVGVDLQFRHIASVNPKLTVVLNGKDIDLTVVVGTTVDTVCVGNDSRLSDARTPLAHVLATTGSHTGTLPWSDLNKTSSSLADLATKAHSNLSDAPTSAHHVRYANSEAVAAVEAAGLVLAASKAIQIDGTPADDTYTGIILSIDTTGCAVGDAVYVDGTNSVLPADADAIATMPAIGIVVAAGKVLTHGVYRDDSVLVLATASKVYISTTAGDLTTTPPAGNGDIVQVFGITVGADMIFVNPSLDWVERV